MARPSEFTEEIGNAILRRISEGEMLTAVCKDEDMPTRLTFYAWMRSRPELMNDYARARLAWADHWAERVMEISINPAGAIDAEGKIFVDNGAIMWAKHLTDNAKWLVGKYAPRTYGDKPAELLPPQSQPLQVSWERIERQIVRPEDSELQKRIAELEAELARRDGKEEPKQLTYNPGPFPAAGDPNVLVDFYDMIRDCVPMADTRDPQTVIIEVMDICRGALSEHYGREAVDAGSDAMA